MTAGTHDAGLGGSDCLRDLQVTAVGELPALEVGPEAFVGIQLRSVTRQPFHLQPVPLGAEVNLHVSAPMAGEAIPDQNHRLAPKVAFELIQEFNQSGVVVGPRAEMKVEAGAAAIPAIAESRGGRDPLPTTVAMDQHRGLPPGRPGLAHRGCQGEAALVFENDPGVLAAGPFFRVGQRSLTQASIFSASRSAARRAGFCRLQPRPRRMRQT